LLYGQAYSASNPGIYWVPPGNCNTTASGNTTGTQGQTISGASAMPVVQAQTSVTGTNTVTFICNISPPQSIKTTGTGLGILDAIFTYAVVTGPLGTQVATLSSGTMNGSTVFSYVAYPTPVGAQTPSTVTPVRADANTLVITPVVASFNTTTTTAGSFFAAKFTPAAPIAWKTDLRQLLMTVTLQGLASTPYTINSAGVLLHIVSAR